MNYNYVYKITFETGHVYYGSRSCKCLPTDDTYLGSPYTHKNYWNDYTPNKEIVAVDFCTREDANSFENFCIELQWLKNKDLSLNASINGLTFNNFGRKFSQEHCVRISESKGKPFYLVSPEGKVFEGTNLSKFARDNNIESSGLCKVFQGKVFHHNGWTASIEMHQLYLEYFVNRGISYQKADKRWVVRPFINGKQKPVTFKLKEDAILFRDSYEKEHNYTFIVQTKVLPY